MESYEEIAGHGIKARIDGKLVVAGNDRLLHREGIPHDDCDAEGTVVNVAVDGVLAGRIIIADEIKPDAADAIRSLKELGVTRTVMLTGDDQERGTSASPRLVGIDEVHAGLLPEEKVLALEAIVRERQSGSGKVAFVGDGINDAPVLTRADVGIAMGGLGSDAAIEAADVVIMDDMPSKVGKAIAIARRTRQIVLQNIVFALAVKAAVIFFGTFGHGQHVGGCLCRCRRLPPGGAQHGPGSAPVDLKAVDPKVVNPAAFYPVGSRALRPCGPPFGAPRPRFPRSRRLRRGYDAGKNSSSTRATPSSSWGKVTLSATAFTSSSALAMATP